MGLDMYLEGKKHLNIYGKEVQTRDGYPLAVETLRLGYWRKHPNLHGYIVNTFANGVDECQAIDLDKEALEKIIAAIEAEELPPTSGFFFGESDGTEKEKDLEVFHKALGWLTTPVNGEYRTVSYEASW